MTRNVLTVSKSMLLEIQVLWQLVNRVCPCSRQKFSAVFMDTMSYRWHTYNVLSLQFQMLGNLPCCYDTWNLHSHLEVRMPVVLLSSLICWAKLSADRMLGPTLQWETVGVCMFQYNDKRVKLYLWDTAGCEQNFDLIPTRYTKK